VPICISNTFLFASDAQRSDIPQTVSFTVLISSTGSADSPSEQSVTLINSIEDIRNAFEALYSGERMAAYRQSLPAIDLERGSAVLLDMGYQGSLGNYIAASKATTKDGEYLLTFATLKNYCLAPSVPHRPFQLLYFDIKIDVLKTRHIEGTINCKNTQ